MIKNLFLLSMVLWTGACTPFGYRDPFLDSALDRNIPIQEAPTEHQCKNFPDCERVCALTYQHPSEVDQCLKLSVSDARRVYQVGSKLRFPVARGLNSIRNEDFELFLRVGAESLIDYADGYIIPRAKKVLAWIARERLIAQSLFSLHSVKYRRFFLNLLKSADPLSAEESLHRSLSEGKTFYEMANIKHNDYAVYMVHEVILEDFCEVDYEYFYFDLSEQQEACVLRVYCHHQPNGEYVHQNNFRFISNVIEYDDVFDYIQNDFPIGLNMNYNTIAEPVCDRVCNSIPDSCL